MERTRSRGREKTPTMDEEENEAYREWRCRVWSSMLRSGVALPTVHHHTPSGHPAFRADKLSPK